MIIDTHAHFVPPALLADVKAQNRLFPSLKTKEEKGSLCFSFAGAEMTRPVMPLLSDVAKRREWLASQDIDRQVVGGWLDSFGYELPADEGADWSRFYNEHLLVGREGAAGAGAARHRADAERQACRRGAGGSA